MSKAKTFEEDLKELEDVVKRLEDQSVGLEDAVRQFERGMELAKRCHEKLASVEKRVDQLIAEASVGEEPATAPFAPEEG